MKLKRIKKINKKHSEKYQAEMPIAFNTQVLYETLNINGHIIDASNYICIATYIGGTNEIQWQGVNNEFMGQVVNTNSIYDVQKLYEVKA